MSDHINPVKVSVCIASYNYDQYIGEAIESVFAQTYENWELIVIDDASTDNSVSIISKLQQRYPDKVIFIPLAENQGVCQTFNQAYARAQGEFIAILGADDRMLPQRLEKQVAYLQEHSGVGVICSDVNTIDESGQGVISASVFSQPIIDLRSQLLEGNFLNAPSAMFRQCILTEVGFLNPVLDYVQDFDHWLRILEHYDIERLPARLTEYRIHGKNLSLQATGENAYASRYETAMVIFNAIKRRDRRINKDLLTQQQIIDEKLFLANAAKKAEYKFLNSFKYALNIVYGLVLDILMLDPKHQQAKKLLNTVYSAFGDEPRSLGNKPITDNEFNLFEQEDKESRSLYQIVVDTYEQTGASLSKIIKGMLKQEEKLITAQIRRDQKVNGNVDQTNLISSTEIRNYFCVNLVSHLVSQAEIKTDYQLGKSIPRKIRYELHELLTVALDGDQTLGQIDPVVQALKEQIRELLENDLYQTWIRKHELREIDAEIIAEQMMLKWQRHPVLHCVLFLLPGEGSLLADTIDSLATQLYSKWHLTVIAETECPDPIFDQVENLHWEVLDNNTLPYDLLNQAINSLDAEWTAFIEPGTRFEIHALAKIAEYTNLYPNWSFIYTDDDQVNSIGDRSSPRFKPDLNLDLLRSSPYIDVGWMRTKELVSMSGIRQLAGAENYDVVLRWLDSYGESVIGHIADVLIHRPKESNRLFDASAGMVALQQHLDRNEIKASIHQGYLDNSYRVEYLHADTPKVSIIIPTKDKLEYLQPCIESLLGKTTYPDFEVMVIDNQSTDPDTLAYYDLLAEQYPEKVTICFYDKPFNFAAMNNFAAQKATGDYLLLLNNDTEIIQGEWLSRMMSYGQRNDVGIVGVRLVYPTTGKVQHVGIVLGINQAAEHPYNGLLGLKDIGHMGRAQLDQNYSAVTAATLLIKKSIYQQVDGMDAEHFSVLYNDVDMCLRVGELGYKIVWTPYVTLVHHGSTSVSELNHESFYTDFQAVSNNKIRAIKEQKMLSERWLARLANDPAYNKNLTLVETDFTVEVNGLQNWDVNVHTRLRCFAKPISGGSGYFRVKQPFNMLSQQGLALCEVGESHLSTTEIARMKPDTYVFQNAIKVEEMDKIHLFSELHPDLFTIFSIDDLIHDLPEKSSRYRSLKASYRDAKTRIRKVLKYCDRLIVTTQPLADLCADMIDDICIVPNYLEGAIWSDLNSKRGQAGKPRVGWAGAQQHKGDLEIIADVVRETADKIDWIFMGMYPENLKPFIKEFHDFVPIDEYPEKLASLNLDLAVAPLEQHPFNVSKSNLRILEYGILGWPVICTDIYPYRSYDAPVTRVINEKQAWIDAIEHALSSPTTLQNAGDKLRQWVLDNFMLEDHIQEWEMALKSQSK